MKIVTRYDPPPIPLRQFDWTAVTDNYEPPDPIGFGRTEAEARADLEKQLADLQDAADLLRQPHTDLRALSAAVNKIAGI
jgi:hypothetical protein